MARQLTKEAMDTLMSDTKLYGDICDALDVKPVSLPKLIQRNSERLTRYDIVLLIAAKMEKDPEEILEEAPAEVLSAQ